MEEIKTTTPDGKRVVTQEDLDIAIAKRDAALQQNQGNQEDTIKLLQEQMLKMQQQQQQLMNQINNLQKKVKKNK